MCVLLVFVYLVIFHSGNLYAPSDFRDEGNYMKLRIAALLGAAAAKNDADAEDISKIVDSAWSTGSAQPERDAKWMNRILWVDDRPNNNYYERRAFEALGIHFTLVESTDEALNKVARNKYAAIISDMGRLEGPREGYVLLDKLRKDGNRTPLFFYSTSNEPEHKQETRDHGGQGCTNDAQELFEMVTLAVSEGAP